MILLDVNVLVLSSFLRIVTHPRVFKEPTPLGTALTAVTEVRDRPNCVSVAPGDRHWEILSGSEWITTDRDYARFSGLRWRHPLS